MIHSPADAAKILPMAESILHSNEPAEVKLERLWRTLTYLQGVTLSRQLSNTIGTRVWGGPFKGMQLTQPVLTDLYGPLLLGCYEQELHPAFERAIAQPYRQILNIGSNYGYYATGLALRMPQVMVHAFDIEPEAQQWTVEMATVNNVQNRVRVAGEFHGEDFATYADNETLVLMDIEGAEKTLLDPALYPALQKMDVIVELHDVNDPSISKLLASRFAATHDVEIIPNNQKLVDFKKILGPGHYFDPYDQLTIAWEKRGGPTPWGVFRKK